MENTPENMRRGFAEAGAAKGMISGVKHAGGGMYLRGVDFTDAAKAIAQREGLNQAQTETMVKHYSNMSGKDLSNIFDLVNTARARHLLQERLYGMASKENLNQLLGKAGNNYRFEDNAFVTGVSWDERGNIKTLNAITDSGKKVQFDGSKIIESGNVSNAHAGGHIVSGAYEKHFNAQGNEIRTKYEGIVDDKAHGVVMTDNKGSIYYSDSKGGESYAGTIKAFEAMQLLKENKELFKGQFGKEGYDKLMGHLKSLGSEGAVDVSMTSINGKTGSLTVKSGASGTYTAQFNDSLGWKRVRSAVTRETTGHKRDATNVNLTGNISRQHVVGLQIS